MLFGDFLAVAVAQHGLEHEADGHRQARDRADAGFFQRGQRTLHSELIVIFDPSRLNSFFVHISLRMPAPMLIISFCNASSVHIVDLVGGVPAPALVLVVVISH